MNFFYLNNIPYILHIPHNCMDEDCKMYIISDNGNLKEMNEYNKDEILGKIIKDVLCNPINDNFIIDVNLIRNAINKL